AGVGVCTGVLGCVACAVASAAESSTLSLHDALPIWSESGMASRSGPGAGGAQDVGDRGHAEGGGVLEGGAAGQAARVGRGAASRSEEHTSELQSREKLVCRLLLEKKKGTAVGEARWS